VVLIDDDTTLDDTSIVSQTIADFDHPRVGAVAIPFRVPPEPEIHKSAPDGSGVWVTSSFIGCSHAVNRELFQAVGGFRESLHHYGEESDFCMRLLNAGWVTRCGRSAPATHHASPLARGTDRQRFFAARNAVLFAWHNVPFPYFPLHLGAVTAREMRQFVRYGGLRATFAGVSRGYRDGIRTWSGRRPLRPEIYRLIRRIKKREPVRFDEIGSALGEAPPKESVVSER
jgi:GT2 family glycosyltransferase